MARDSENWAVATPPPTRVQSAHLTGWAQKAEAMAEAPRGNPDHRTFTGTEGTQDENDRQVRITVFSKGSTARLPGFQSQLCY